MSIDYKLFGTSWCMVDALVYGTGLLQIEVHVGALLMYLFMVLFDYMLFGTGWCMVDALVYGTG
jgi:hypothetical protein